MIGSDSCRRIGCQVFTCHCRTVPINPFSGSRASRTMVSIVNELEFSGKNAPVVLAFDVSQLRDGIYELQVKVTDVNSEREISGKKLLRLY